MTRATDGEGAPTRRWWRVVLLVVVSVAGVAGAVGCALAWLLVGFMGTPVAPWEPVAYPAGVVACLSAPVLLARVLLGPGRRPMGRVVLPLVVAVVAAGLLAAGVLGATA